VRKGGREEEQERACQHVMNEWSDRTSGTRWTNEPCSHKRITVSVWFKWGRCWPDLRGTELRAQLGDCVRNWKSLTTHPYVIQSLGSGIHTGEVNP
jgi:hypothetical protein